MDAAIRLPITEQEQQGNSAPDLKGAMCHPECVYSGDCLATALKRP
ncbi:MAG: hypothetical protein OXP36_10520 [Gammaproteobacteria bacterium]|nr:hypothetical protein [Gammaproteobacteria bacterium]